MGWGGTTLSPLGPRISLLCVPLALQLIEGPDPSLIESSCGMLAVQALRAIQAAPYPPRPPTKTNT